MSIMVHHTKPVLSHIFFAQETGLSILDTPSISETFLCHVFLQLKTFVFVTLLESGLRVILTKKV